MNKPKIVVVEDDFLLALVTRKYLEREGFDCYTFINATDFFNFYDQNKDIELVILDVKIKGNMNGLQLFEKFSFISNIPVVFTTGNSEVRTDPSLKLEQVKGILIKPINLEEITQIISGLKIKSL